MGIEDEKAPTFIQKPKLREDDEEDIIIFECVVLAYPKPDVAWFFENKKIKKTAKLKPEIKELGSNRYYIALKLHDPEDDDSGLYRLTVTNKKGDAAGSIKANFRGEILQSYSCFLLISNILVWKKVIQNHK
ncbi:ig-like domain-containing protein [Nephila pilipes]|uniref:Ig-like domain-containing protein n=1 Tax=Nephila pilipes TaxID=299642 RepID=A0A8X6T2X3_NEPPI|nr:ig-like domain-containing protein [Nephila pilipes]